VIVQRIARNLKERDWGAALIEVAIVVVGTFIGLQVDAWIDARNARNAEQEYLQRLHGDIERLLPLQQERMEVRLEFQKKMGDAAELFFNDASEEAWTDAHCRALASSHIFSPLPAAFLVLNEMLSTGAVALIRDVRLRDALSELQIHVSRSEELVARLSRNARMLSRAYPDAVWEEVEIAVERGQRHVDRAFCDLDAIRSNRALLNDFTDNYSRHRAYATTGMNETHELFRRVHGCSTRRSRSGTNPKPIRWLPDRFRLCSRWDRTAPVDGCILALAAPAPGVWQRHNRRVAPVRIFRVPWCRVLFPGFAMRPFVSIFALGTSESLCTGATVSLRDQPAWLRRAWFGHSKSASPMGMTSGTTRSTAFPTETRSGQSDSEVPLVSGLRARAATP